MYQKVVSKQIVWILALALVVGIISSVPEKVALAERKYDNVTIYEGASGWLKSISRKDGVLSFSARKNAALSTRKAYEEEYDGYSAKGSFSIKPGCEWTMTNINDDDETMRENTTFKEIKKSIRDYKYNMVEIYVDGNSQVVRVNVARNIPK